MKKIKKTQEFIAKNIANTIIIQEIYDWKDDDLWELLQDDFKEYTKDDFRLVNNNNIRRLYKFI